MKWMMSIEEFKDWIYLINNHLNQEKTSSENFNWHNEQWEMRKQCPPK